MTLGFSMFWPLLKRPRVSGIENWWWPRCAPHTSQCPRAQHLQAVLKSAMVKSHYIAEQFSFVVCFLFVLLCFLYLFFFCTTSVVLVELHAVFYGPKTLVEKLAKDLVEILAKSSGPNSAEQFCNPGHGHPWLRLVTPTLWKSFILKSSLNIPTFAHCYFFTFFWKCLATFLTRFLVDFGEVWGRCCQVFGRCSKGRTTITAKNEKLYKNLCILMFFIMFLDF